MKIHVFLGLFLLILAGCSSYHKADRPTSPKEAPPVVVTEKKSKDLGNTRAIFHIIEPLGTDLILYHTEKNREERIHVDKTLSQIGLEPGHWQIVGFIMGGKEFKVINADQKFTFNLKKKQYSYVGSYIFQCPKVNQTHLNQLKKMNFFNRYPFSHGTSLCEMVVGSDHKNVSRVWKKLNPKERRRLSLGF